MTCMMNYEIATHLSGARNDTSTLSHCEADEVSPFFHCGERSDGAISRGAIKFPVGIRAERSAADCFWTGAEQGEVAALRA
jgi:hypothetical protein